MSKQLFTIMQIFVSAGLVAFVLLQSRGSGLGEAWGATKLYHSKKGLEKILLGATIVLAVAFLILSLINGLIG